MADNRDNDPNQIPDNSEGPPSETPKGSRSRVRQVRTIRTSFTYILESRSTSEPPTPDRRSSSEVAEPKSEARDDLAKSWLGAWDNFTLLGTPKEETSSEPPTSEETSSRRPSEATAESKIEDRDNLKKSWLDAWDNFTLLGTPKEETSSESSKRQQETSRAEGGEQKEEKEEEETKQDEDEEKILPNNGVQKSHSDALSAIKNFFQTLMKDNSDTDEDKDKDKDDAEPSDNVHSVIESPSFASHWQPVFQATSSPTQNQTAGVPPNGEAQTTSQPDGGKTTEGETPKTFETATREDKENKKTQGEIAGAEGGEGLETSEIPLSEQSTLQINSSEENSKDESSEEMPEQQTPRPEQTSWESETKRKRIDEILRPLHLSNKQAYSVVQAMGTALSEGLSAEAHDRASVKCLPAFITRPPTGRETGRYLVIDLGGTNLRIMCVVLTGHQRQPFILADKTTVPEDLMRGEGGALFDFIASALFTFCQGFRLLDEDLPLAFTFSFPVEQTSLTSGFLTEWTKGFAASDVEGQDVCKLLEQALQRHGGLKRIRLVALLNDTTGVLLSAAFHDTRCKVGLILGTGSNACYLEESQNVERCREEGNIDCPCNTHMVINTEWGAFGENGELDSLATKWDRAMDAASVHPGRHLYEKMTAGMYLGELIRRILLDLAREGLVFPHCDHSPLEQPGVFQTRHMCLVEADPVGDYHMCREAVLRKVLGTDGQFLDDDCYTVRQVCEEVSRRACVLLGAGIAGLLKKMNCHDVVVAVDGTLFRSHHLFPVLITKKVAQLMGADYKFELRFCNDGSGVGAAVAAAITEKCP